MRNFLPILMPYELSFKHYLGAERVRNLLEELTTKSGKSEEEMRDSEYPLLLRELKILQDALPSSTSNQVSTVKKENEKNDFGKEQNESALNTTKKKN
ncbi:MAG: hypothetical protein ACTSPG_10030 [Candidatus Hodarchaeales archaeon]